MVELNRKKLVELAKTLFACDVSALAEADKPKGAMVCIAYSLGTRGATAKLWRDAKGNFFYCDKPTADLFRH
jgi:hypothetical protein